MKSKHGLFLCALVAGFFAVLGCDDDESNSGTNGSNSGTVVDKENWIGSPCKCIGNGCSILGIPLPSPDPELGFTIEGCENLTETIEGARLVCLRTITQKEYAPPAHFTDGYCSLSAVGCTGDPDTCEKAIYGNATEMKACPEGSTLIDSTFDYTLLGQFDVEITNKTCAKNCNTDEDCTGEGIECISHGKAKFCYDRQNFEFMNRGFTVKSF